MEAKLRKTTFSRPSLLMLALLCYKWSGTLCSDRGSARKYLYEELYSLFPDSFGARGGSTDRHDKDSVLRTMRDKGLILLAPPMGNITRTISITSEGTRHLRQGLDDQRYHDELQLIRDYYSVDGALVEQERLGRFYERVENTVQGLEEEPEVIAEVVEPEKQPEIAISPSWDPEPTSERVGWAILSGVESWHVVGDDLGDLFNTINDLEEVRAIYPLSVTHALPPKA